MIREAPNAAEAKYLARITVGIVVRVQSNSMITCYQNRRS